MMELILEIGPTWILLAMLVAALGAYVLGRRFLVVRRPLAFAGVVLAITVLASGGRWKYRQWKGRDYYHLESIDVPRGYTLKHGAGEDSYVGEIRFPDGRRIRMDIGFLAGIYANPEEPEKFLWITERNSRDGRICIGLRPPAPDFPNVKKLLCVSYLTRTEVVNFMADVETEREIAEVLSIVLT